MLQTQTLTVHFYLTFGQKLIFRMGVLIPTLLSQVPTSNQGDVGSSPAQGKNQFFGWVCWKVKTSDIVILDEFRIL